MRAKPIDYAAASIGAGCLAAAMTASAAGTLAAAVAVPLAVWLASRWEHAARQAAAAGAIKSGPAERET